MKLVKLIMPSQGDMELVKQDGGTILLKPTYFGGECAGPIIQFVETAPTPAENSSAPAPADSVLASYRIRIKKSGELKLASAD